MLREDAGVLVAAVAVQVFQGFDPALGGASFRRTGWIVQHLDDPELPVFVKGHRHRAFNFRLGRRELHPQTWVEAE